MQANPSPQPQKQPIPAVTEERGKLTLPAASARNVLASLEHRPVVTIDGGAGSGKSSVALMVAEKLGGAEVIDSGRWFRALALICSLTRVNPGNSNDVEFLAERVTFINAPRGSYSEIIARERAGDKIVHELPFSSAELDSQEIAENASIIATNPRVREIFRARQEDLAQDGCITVGRAQGTEVFSEQFSDKTAQPVLRFFLHADLDTRATRRFVQSRKRAPESHELADIKAALQDRDFRDMTRKVAPLLTPDDARERGYIVIETTNLTIEQVAEKLTAAIHNKFPNLTTNSNGSSGNQVGANDC